MTMNGTPHPIPPVREEPVGEIVITTRPMYASLLNSLLVAFIAIWGNSTGG